MNDKIRDEVLEYIKAFDYEPIKPHEITVKHYMSMMDITEAAARSRLKSLVEKDILYKRKTRIDEFIVNAYGKIEDKPS